MLLPVMDLLRLYAEEFNLPPMRLAASKATCTAATSGPLLPAKLQYQPRALVEFRFARPGRGHQCCAVRRFILERDAELFELVALQFKGHDYGTDIGAGAEIVV